MTERARKCFFCDENEREDGDFVCKSCKEEHPMCYICGQRKRNMPFKYCTQCYQAQRQSHDSSSGVLSRSSENEVSVALDNLALTKDTSASPRVLIPLKNDQNTYKEIAEHFKKEWIKLTPSIKKPPDPAAIFAIQNKEVSLKYRRYGTDIRRSGKSSNSELFFHGTKLLCDLVTNKTTCDDPECGICGISLQGFDETRVGTNIPRFQRFGKGIYLAPNSSKCHDYTQGVVEYGMRAQLLCLVAQGAKCVLMQDNTKLTEAPEGFHSVYGKKGGSLNFDEIVVFDSNAVWPQFVVVYELNGVGKIAS